MVHFFLAFFEQANHPLFRRLHHTLAFRNIINSRFVYRSPGQTDVRGIDWSRVSQQATVRCSARSVRHSSNSEMLRFRPALRFLPPGEF